MKILGPERKTENIESAFQHIEHQELVAIDLNDRGSEKEDQQAITNPFAGIVIRATGLLRKDPGSFAFFADRCYGIPESFVHALFASSLSPLNSQLPLLSQPPAPAAPQLGLPPQGLHSRQPKFRLPRL